MMMIMIIIVIIIMIIMMIIIMIKSLDEGESYKYLRELEDNRIKHQEVKEIMSKEHLRRVQKVLESKLNSGNLIKAINTWAVLCSDI